MGEYELNSIKSESFEEFHGIPSAHEIHTIVFDFDGVFTDNKVFVNQDGVEFVRCDRGDGLGIRFLKNFCASQGLEINIFILSTEGNSVVAKRSEKMGVSCVQGVAHKAEYLKSYLVRHNVCPMGLIFLGNDINDFEAMELAGYAIAPKDAHPLIQNIADLVIDRNGGEGFVREFVELFIRLKNISLLTVV